MVMLKGQMPWYQIIHEDVEIVDEDETFFVLSSDPDEMANLEDFLNLVNLRGDPFQVETARLFRIVLIQEIITISTACRLILEAKDQSDSVLILKNNLMVLAAKGQSDDTSIIVIRRTLIKLSDQLRVLSNCKSAKWFCDKLALFKVDDPYGLISALL